MTRWTASSPRHYVPVRETRGMLRSIDAVTFGLGNDQPSKAT